MKPEWCKILDIGRFLQKRGNPLKESLDFIPPSLLFTTIDGNTNNKGKCALAGYILVPFTDGWSSLLRMRKPFENCPFSCNIADIVVYFVLCNFVLCYPSVLCFVFLVFCKLFLYLGTFLSVASKFSHIHSSLSWLHYFVQISFHRLCQFYFSPLSYWSLGLLSNTVKFLVPHCILLCQSTFPTLSSSLGQKQSQIQSLWMRFLLHNTINILLAELDCLHLRMSSINDVVFNLACLWRYERWNTNHMIKSKCPEI